MEETAACVLPQLSITPWPDAEQLFLVYRNIFGQEEEEEDVEVEDETRAKRRVESMTWARNQLIIWKIRLPFSLDAIEFETTASLLSALIRDKEQETRGAEGGNSACDQFDLSSLYSTAIVKFCDLLGYYQMVPSAEDSTREVVTRSRQKVSKGLKRVALKLGLPEWLVDCRHEACHSSTPALILLRQGAHIALNWIHTHFWAVKVKTSHEKKVHPFYDLIREFMSASPETRLRLKKRVKQSLNGNKYQGMDVIASLLVTMSCLESDRLNRDLDMDDAQEAHIQSSVMKTARPLLALVHRMNLTHMLLHKFVSEFDSQDIQVRNHSLVWFIEILTAINGRNGCSKFEKCLKLKKNVRHTLAFRMDWLKLLYHVVKKPSEHSAALLQLFPKLVGNLVTDNQFKMFSRLVAIYSGSEGVIKRKVGEKRSVEETDKVKNVDDLKAFKSRLQSHPQNGIDWFQISLGSTPSPRQQESRAEERMES